jgi:hypothetical protein
MNSRLHAAASAPGTPHVRSVRVEGEGCVAMVDVDLVDAEGEATQRGHVVCLSSLLKIAVPSDGTAAAAAFNRA